MASRGINKVILIGYLGQDPETRYMQNGNAVTNITLATSETWKDKNSGEIREKTEWHRIVFFNKLAEIAREYLKKGSQVYIEGALQTRKWKDQSGIERYITEIIVSVGGTMQMLGNRNSSSVMSTEFSKNGDHNLLETKIVDKKKELLAPQQELKNSLDFDDDEIPF